MTQYFNQILLGRKIYEGKVLPSSMESSTTNVIAVERYLGEQSFGEIFQCRFATPGSKPFLMKVPGPPLGETHKYLQNEIDKLESLANPGHPQIPMIQKSFLLGNEKKLPFYLYSLSVPGGIRFPELKAHKPISHLDALKIFYLLAKCLGYLAERHIVHGDINADTVQFYDRMPVLMHWPFAKSLDEIARIVAEQFAPPYADIAWLPPEVISVEVKNQTTDVFFHPEELGEKTDVWGVGLLLMYYLTNSQLFDDKAPDENALTFIQRVPSFSQKQILSRYRNRCKIFLEQSYLGFMPPVEEEQFISDIYQVCQSTEDTFAAIAFLERDLVSKFAIDTLVATRNKLLASGKSKLQMIREVYLQIIMTLFDMCTAQVKVRVRAPQLVQLIECLLPGLAAQANMLLTRAYIPLFTETANVDSMSPIGHTHRLTKQQRFHPTSQLVPEKPRAQPRYSMKDMDGQRVDNLVQEERHRYLNEGKGMPRKD